MDVYVETAVTWPTTPLPSVTGMSAAMPEELPLSMVTVRDHSSLDTPTTRAPTPSVP